MPEGIDHLEIYFGAAFGTLRILPNKNCHNYYKQTGPLVGLIGGSAIDHVQLVWLVE